MRIPRETEEGPGREGQGGEGEHCRSGEREEPLLLGCDSQAWGAPVYPTQASHHAPMGDGGLREGGGLVG